MEKSEKDQETIYLKNLVNEVGGWRKFTEGVLCELGFDKEILDSDHKRVCRLSCNLERNSEGQIEIKSIFLTNNGNSIDLVTLAKTKGAKKILLTNRCCNTDGIIEMDKMDSIFDVAILLHELGHQEQNNEPGQRAIIKHHYKKDHLTRKNVRLEECLAILRDFPNSRSYFRELLQDLIGENEDCQGFMKAYNDWENQTRKLGKITLKDVKLRGASDQPSLVEKIGNLIRFQEKLSDKMSSHPKANEILRLPIQFLEWTANARAIELIGKAQEILDINILDREFSYNGEIYNVATFLNESVEMYYEHPKDPDLDLRRLTTRIRPIGETIPN